MSDRKGMRQRGGGRAGAREEGAAAPPPAVAALPAREGEGVPEVVPSREGALFRVRAQPGARRTAVSGLHGGALKVAVQAPPEKGRANEALLRFLEGALGLGRGALEIASGETAREKRLLARGADARSLAARLAGLVAARGGHGHGHGE